MPQEVAQSTRGGWVHGPRADHLGEGSDGGLSRGHYHWQHEPCWYAVRDGATGHWERRPKPDHPLDDPGARGRRPRPWHAKACRMHAPADCQQQRRGRCGFRTLLRVRHYNHRREIAGRIVLAIEIGPAVRRRRGPPMAGVHRQQAVLERTGEPFPTRTTLQRRRNKERPERSRAPASSGRRRSWRRQRVDGKRPRVGFDRIGEPTMGFDVDPLFPQPREEPRWCCCSSPSPSGSPRQSYRQARAASPAPAPSWSPRAAWGARQWRHEVPERRAGHASPPSALRGHR